MRIGTYSLSVAWLLLISTLPCIAAKDQTPPTTTFTIQSVTLSGDECILSAKSAEGITYYASAYAWHCTGMKTGDRYVGYTKTHFYPFASPSMTTDLYFDAGRSKKGKQQWDYFSVSSQSQ
ncbi:MAG: hypothetical protein ABSB50_00215 [Terracidiphilus sp.]|jgi:hypothetical protein